MKSGFSVDAGNSRLLQKAAGFFAFTAGHIRALGSRPGFVLLLVFNLLASGIVTAGCLYYQNRQKQFRAGIAQQLTIIADLKAGDLARYRQERCVADRTAQLQAANDEQESLNYSVLHHERGKESTSPIRSKSKT
jgi:hypothetical protein